MVSSTSATSPVALVAYHSGVVEVETNAIWSAGRGPG